MVDELILDSFFNYKNTKKSLATIISLS